MSTAELPSWPIPAASPTLAVAKPVRLNLILAGSLVLAGAAALSIDLHVARWFAEGNCPGAFQKLAMLAEVFSHGIGVLAILATVAVLDPLRRRLVPRLLASSLGAGLAANGFKLLITRTRPGSFDMARDVFDSFGDLFPIFTAGYPGQGCPSAHAATAWGLAIGLSALYPRGRWLFPALAALATMQRMVTASHFLSDALWGASVGVLFATWIMYNGRVGRWFASVEQPSRMGC